MERFFTVLETVFPADFMSVLWQEYRAYNDTVGPEVSGDPVRVLTYGEEFQTRWAEYMVSETMIKGYLARFSLWWWQATCPPGLTCSYHKLPGLERTGESSIVFQTIILRPSGSSATNE